MMRIHKEGTGLIISEFVIFMAINISIFSFLGITGLSLFIALICLVFFVLTINFFRYPQRICPIKDKEHLIIAPADGRIVVIEETMEKELLFEKCIQVSIFMSITNVHANWLPVSGTIEHVSHQDGRFQGAYLPKSSTENERSAVIIRTKEGHRILVRQVAGALARRISTYPKEGDFCQIDDPLGFIKFGSRVDLYLPLGTQIDVKMDQKTKANITMIGRLPI